MPLTLYPSHSGRSESFPSYSPRDPCDGIPGEKHHRVIEKAFHTRTAGVGAGSRPEVRQSIVEAVVVAMMDLLIGPRRVPECFGHHQPMLDHRGLATREVP